MFSNFKATMLEEKIHKYKLMFCTTVGTFVKSLVELIATVAASDFNNDFLFDHFLSHCSLHSIGRWRVRCCFVSGTTFSHEQKRDHDYGDNYGKQENWQENNSYHSISTIRQLSVPF
jgi:hypothetical protein